MTEDLQLAIKKVDKLFNDRDGAEWWAENIIEASRHLTDSNDWTLFYSYLSNPSQFDPNAKLEVIDDKMEIEFEYPPNMKEFFYKNGVDTIIHVKNMSISGDSDDEKTF